MDIIANKWVARIACITAVLLTLYFDYSYIMRLVNNWDMYVHSPIGNSLIRLWITGAVIYSFISFFVGVLVKWCWK